MGQFIQTSLPGCRTLLIPEGLLGGGLGCGSLFTLQSACGSGVQKFARRVREATRGIAPGS